MRRVRLVVDRDAARDYVDNMGPLALERAGIAGVSLRLALDIIERFTHVAVHCEICDGRGSFAVDGVGEPTARECAACDGRGWMESP